MVTALLCSKWISWASLARRKMSMTSVALWMLGSMSYFFGSSENKVLVLVLRFPVRTCDQVVIYICTYEVETSKDVVDESLERFCSTYLSGRHAQKFVSPKKVTITVLKATYEAIGVRLYGPTRSTFGKKAVPVKIAIKSLIGSEQKLCGMVFVFSDQYSLVGQQSLLSI